MVDMHGCDMSNFDGHVVYDARSAVGSLATVEKIPSRC